MYRSSAPIVVEVTAAGFAPARVTIPTSTDAAAASVVAVAEASAGKPVDFFAADRYVVSPRIENLGKCYTFIQDLIAGLIPECIGMARWLLLRTFDLRNAAALNIALLVNRCISLSIHTSLRDISRRSDYQKKKDSRGTFD